MGFFWCPPCLFCSVFFFVMRKSFYLPREKNNPLSLTNHYLIFSLTRSSPSLSLPLPPSPSLSLGMERADLLKANAEIFKVQGEGLNKVANRDTLRVVVVGNPANTNAWIASQCAPDLSPTQFSAMTRLDHD